MITNTVIEGCAAAASQISRTTVLVVVYRSCPSSKLAVAWMMPFRGRRLVDVSCEGARNVDRQTTRQHELIDRILRAGTFSNTELDEMLRSCEETYRRDALHECCE